LKGGGGAGQPPECPYMGKARNRGQGMGFGDDICWGTNLDQKKKEKKE